VRVLVDAEEEDGVVALKRMLSAIAVVNIPVNYRHSRNFAFGAQILRCNGDIVEQTEAHDLFEFGMMARWADTTKGIIDFTGENGIYRGNPGSCS
jgi:hypothetical protein